jgi:prefoldin subunit 5
MTDNDKIDTLRSSEDSLRAKLAEVELQLQRLIDFEIEYEATCKTQCESAISRIAKMERQKKEMLIELGKLVYARK